MINEEKKKKILVAVAGVGIIGIVAVLLMFFFRSRTEITKENGEQEEKLVYVDERSGKSYRYEKIGDQFWFSENLAVGEDEADRLYYKETKAEWREAAEEEIPAYSVYNNNENNKEVHGYLYNFYAVEFSNLCPGEWSVPTDEDWYELERYLKEEDSSCNSQRMGSLGCDPAGAKMKTLHENEEIDWNSSDFNCSGGDKYDCTGLNVAPSGSRYTSGTYFGLGSSAYFWTSSANEESGFFRNLRERSAGILRNESSKGMGMPIRCVKR